MKKSPRRKVAGFFCFIIVAEDRLSSFDLCVPKPVSASYGFDGFLLLAHSLPRIQDHQSAQAIAYMRAPANPA